MDLLPSLTPGSGADDRRAAVTVAGRSLSLGDLAGAAGAVADRCSGMTAVAVHATATLETVVAVVGALKAGIPVIPVPPDAGPLERDHILGDCRADAILVGPQSESGPGSDGLGAAGVELVPVDVAARSDGPRSLANIDRLAMVLYTSGTTGLPKGVMLTAAAIATDLDLLAEAWAWTGDDVLAHGLPLFHVHGLILGVLGPLRVGSPLIHTGRPTPEAYAAAGASLYFGVPTVWSRVAADPSAARALRPARLLVSGSAGLPVPVFERLEESAGQGPLERYGMTETLITVSGRAGEGRQAGWVGRALPGVDARLVDERGERVPADGESVGALEVRGPTMMAGYHNRPDATRAVWTGDGWFRTGDVACTRGDGWIRILGRQSTDLIKTGGYRVGAGEVESALLAHPAVSEAAVVGLPDDDLGQIIVAYVVAAGVTGPELCDFVAASLSVHKRPRWVELVGDLPRNAMGKVQKGLLIGE